MNITNEELFKKFLKNKIRFLMEMQEIGVDEDDFDNGQLTATKEILSHFEVLVKSEPEETSADLDMRDKRG